jgi:hypothetical protein
MNEDKVYSALSKQISSKDVPAFIEQFELVINNGFDNTKAADMLAWCAAEITMKLWKDGVYDQAIPILKRWLEFADKIPASAKRKQYYASFVVELLEKQPELADEFESKLLDDDYVEISNGRLFSEIFSKIGKTDKVQLHVSKTMQAGATCKDILDSNALSNLYETNTNFKEFLDKLENDRLNYFANPNKEPNPAIFDEVLAAAMADLAKDIYESKPQRVLDVIKFKGNEYHARIEEFLKSGFNQLKTVAAKKSALINGFLFDTLARTIALWQNPSFSDLLINEFNYVVADSKEIKDGISRHYELNQTAGTIALALTALNYKGEMLFLDKFLGTYGKWYKGDDFVMKVMYAKWMITGDAAGALSYLTNKENTKGFSYAICALTDLDSKDSKSAIKELATSVNNPVTNEVIKESLSRLGKQAQAPQWKDRMIHLFGVVTPGEKALGKEIDNVFVIRAQKAENNPEIGTVYEVDDSAPDDI